MMGTRCTRLLTPMIRFSLEQDPSGGLDDVVKEYVAIFQSLGHEIEDHLILRVLDPRLLRLGHCVFPRGGM